MHILKLIFRNALRHKLRTSLTILGITIAILAFGILRTLVSAWYSGVEASSSARLITRNSISLVFSLPLSYKEKIRQIPGVKGVSYAIWFNGAYISEKTLFLTLPSSQKRSWSYTRSIYCLMTRKPHSSGIVSLP